MERQVGRAEKGGRGRKKCGGGGGQGIGRKSGERSTEGSRERVSGLEIRPGIDCESRQARKNQK